MVSETSPRSMVASLDRRRAFRESTLVSMKDLNILDSGETDNYSTMRSNVRSKWLLLPFGCICLTRPSW